MEFEHLLSKGSSTLDVGCGEGQNVIYLARQAWTDLDAFDLSPSGIHIMQIFTDTVPASPDIAGFAIGLAKDGEIAELYKDWEILQFRSYVFEDEHPGVPKHFHASNKLVARKK